MTREEAKQYVEWVELSNNHLLKPEFFELIKKWVNGKKIGFIEDFVNGWDALMFDLPFEDYHLEKEKKKVTLELTGEQVKQVETILGNKI